MAFPAKLHVLLLASLLASSTLVASAAKSGLNSDLLARLKLDEEGPSSCWDALFEVQSCGGEVVLFFLNGEARLGANCCQAIRTIERQCWPSMLGSLGITAEESDVLRRHCVAAGGGGGTATTPPPAASVDRCYCFPRLLP